MTLLRERMPRQELSVGVCRAYTPYVVLSDVAASHDVSRRRLLLRRR